MAITFDHSGSRRDSQLSLEIFQFNKEHRNLINVILLWLLSTFNFATSNCEPLTKFII